MKAKVTYSKFATIITILISLVLLVGCILTIHEEITFFILLSIFIILILFSLIYGAYYIKADSKYVYLRSVLKSKKILIENIESIQRFQPTMGAIRICGSGGYMGYWGLFREGDIGRYYAFYGKSSDCFIIRMKNGDKYVLGCENPDKMVAYIKSQMN